MKIKHLYIHTIGCQMNIYDAELMARLLEPLGYEAAETPEKADLILVNTCAIRAKAEQKLFSFLGRLSNFKKQRPELIIGVGGCVAQQEGRGVIKRVPHVDFVFGTHAITRLPDMVSRAAAGHRHLVDTEMRTDIREPDPAPFPAPGGISRFVTIMQGCDNYCAYCVVPHVRGREASRRPERIIAEIEHLVAAGTREITLLGQNVNSYGQKEGLCSFSDLLRSVNTIRGLERIRFTTSHPKDLSEELMSAFTQLDKLCPHIHLPVQSGANRILRRMNRKYTREHYLEKVARLRSHCPEIAVSSDIIAGFPGETAADFQLTLDLMAAVGFDSVFAFKYSDRPSAPAARFADKITETEKTARLQALLSLQDGISRARNQAMIGSTVSLLVEGHSKKQSTAGQAPDTDLIHDLSPGKIQWTGRTPGHKIVNFDQTVQVGHRLENFSGRTMNVTIEKAFPHSLWGRLETAAPASKAWKGDNCCAA